eukprot:4679662-Pyramimonas_sp.AAC.1
MRGQTRTPLPPPWLRAAATPGSALSAAAPSAMPDTVDHEHPVQYMSWTIAIFAEYGDRGGNSGRIRAVTLAPEATFGVAIRAVILAPEV